MIEEPDIFDLMSDEQLNDFLSSLLKDEPEPNNQFTAIVDGEVEVLNK